MQITPKREQRKARGIELLKEVIAPLQKELPPPAQEAMGFFTDTSLCIGCKACEVACKQWNQLPATTPEWSGTSYDNTRQLSAHTWRHVQFVEASAVSTISNSTGRTALPMYNNSQSSQDADSILAVPPGTALPFFNSERWLMHSDVCKHCANAPCHEACPTGAIIRTEFDTVYVQQDICNGCGYCIVACPFGVIARDDIGDRHAHKCTLCYDRLKDGMEPACAKACPTASITFGPVAELKARAQERVGELRERGVQEAQLYGADQKILDGGLNSFFLLLDEPEVYNLPRNPSRPSQHVVPASFWSVFTAAILGIAGILFFKKG